jgi:hypothetical protein
VELSFTVAFEPASQAELRPVRCLRRTWPAGHLGPLAVEITLAIGPRCRVRRFSRADAGDAA